MGYGTSPTKWTVLTANKEMNPSFDLVENDVLEFTGSGDGSVGSIVKRHRKSKPTIDWGDESFYDATTDPSLPKVTGVHIASGTRRDKFELTIAPKAAPTKDEHGGNVTLGDGGTEGYGTWTAEEGG